MVEVPVCTVVPVTTATNTTAAAAEFVTTDGTWTGNPTFTYLWFVRYDGTDYYPPDIQSNTTNTFLTWVADGFPLWLSGPPYPLFGCKVTATNSAGSDFILSSVFDSTPPAIQ